MKIVKTFKKLCLPAQIYLAISLISLTMIYLQNCNDSHMYRVGTMVVQSPCHNLAFFAMKLLYVLLWTWILNKLCANNLTGVSWLLVLLPYIAMFLMIGLLILTLQV